MDSAIIETHGCPLDPDLLKSWERFSLESSHSFTSSDLSESADEETDIKHDALIQQLKSLSFADVSDSKYASPKYSNEITEINAQKKDNSEDLIILESEEDEKNQSTSLSSFKNEEFLKCEVEVYVKSVFPKLSNKNFDSNSRKKNNTEKIIFVDNTESNENQFCLSSFENNKLLNNDYKSSSDASAEEESDSDDDDDDVEESVTLRERYPSRHNRPGNNKEQRTTPFPQNHSKTYNQHLYSNSSSASANYHSTLNNFNVSHYGYDYQNNSTHSERYNRTFPPYLPNSKSVSNEEFGSIVSSILADQLVNGVIPCDITDQRVNDIISCDRTDQIVNGVIPCAVTDEVVNNVIPCAVTDQVANGVIPCAVTDQIANGIIPYTVADEEFDSVVPCAGDIGYVNDVSYFDNLDEKIFHKSVDRNCEVTYDRDCEVTHFDKLTAEEMDWITKYLTESRSESFPSQNHLNLIGDNCIATTSKEISYSKCNHYNFATESDGLNNSFSNINYEETSVNSNLHKESGIMERSSKSYGYECLANRSGNYSNMVSKNFTSINSECLSPGTTSDFNDVSEEIETFISREHEIVQWEEMKEWVMKEQKNESELSPPVTESSWNMLPFLELDSNSISECVNASECELSDKKKSSKSKRIKHTRKSTCKAEEPKIYRIWGTEARDKLFHSASFSIGKCELEIEKMRHQIKNGELGTEQKKIIHFLKKNRKTKYKGTNLHYAIISGNIEKVFCIVELHKECHGTTNEINLRDCYNKTVLDYAKEKEMDLLIDYLEENDAKECGSCLVTV